MKLHGPARVDGRMFFCMFSVFYQYLQLVVLPTYFVCHLFLGHEEQRQNNFDRRCRISGELFPRNSRFFLNKNVITGLRFGHV